MTTPKTWAVGEIVTAAMLNTEVRDRVKQKELFVPVTLFDDHGTYAVLVPVGSDFPGALLDTLNDAAMCAFRCPADFGSIAEAVIVTIPQATQAAANWDIASNYGGLGEAYNVHTGEDTTTTYNVTQYQIYEVSIAGILTSLAAGDYVGIRVAMSTAGHSVGIVGIRFKYNVT